MIAILGGLGAALAWSIATLLLALQPGDGPTPVLASVMLVGLAIAAPLAVATGFPKHSTVRPESCLPCPAVATSPGCCWCTPRRGRAGRPCPPLVSTEGAIAAVIALAAGESIAPAAAGAIALIAAGVALSSIPADNVTVINDAHPAG
jgi:drug/metabolite transporter (DMT)-like permease